MAIKSRIETTSKVSLKFISRINLGRRGAHMHRALDPAQSPRAPIHHPPPPPHTPIQTHTPERAIPRQTKTTRPHRNHQQPLPPPQRRQTGPKPTSRINHGRPGARPVPDLELQSGLKQSVTEAYQQIDSGRRGAPALRPPFWTQPTSPRSPSTARKGLSPG